MQAFCALKWVLLNCIQIIHLHKKDIFYGKHFLRTRDLLTRNT